MFSFPGKYQKEFEESIRRQDNKVFNHKHARIFFYDNKEVNEIEEKKDETIEEDLSEENINEIKSNNKLNMSIEYYIIK